MYVAGTWELDDQLAEAAPDGLHFVPADPLTGKPTDKVIQPVTREFSFILYPSSPRLAALLAKAGTRDIHELGSKCLETLTDYLTFCQPRP